MCEFLKSGGSSAGTNQFVSLCAIDGMADAFEQSPHLAQVLAHAYLVALLTLRFLLDLSSNERDPGRNARFGRTAGMGPNLPVELLRRRSAIPSP
jgi:hypothetical protein